MDGYIELTRADGSPVAVNAGEVLSIERSAKGAAFSRIRLSTIDYEITGTVAEIRTLLSVRDIRHVPFSMLVANATKEVLAGIAGKQIQLVAMRLATEASDADITIEDEDGNNIGGFLHMGTGTGGSHHSEINLTHNLEGWCVTPVGKGLQIGNDDLQDVDGIIVVRVL